MLRWTIALVIVNAVYVCVAFPPMACDQIPSQNESQSAAGTKPARSFRIVRGRRSTNTNHAGKYRGSTAYNCRYETWTELLPFPFTDFSSRADHVIFEEPCVLYRSMFPSRSISPLGRDSRGRSARHSRPAALRLHTNPSHLQGCVGVAPEICQRGVLCGEGWIGLLAEIHDAN